MSQLLPVFPQGYVSCSLQLDAGGVNLAADGVAQTGMFV